MQSRIESLIEAWANVLVGYLVAVAANYWLLPLWGFPVNVQESFEIGLAFTGVSLVRSYIIRRWFNGLSYSKAPKS
jgi:hypothetical protein